MSHRRCLVWMIGDRSPTETNNLEWLIFFPRLFFSVGLKCALALPNIVVDLSSYQASESLAGRRAKYNFRQISFASQNASLELSFISVSTSNYFQLNQFVAALISSLEKRTFFWSEWINYSSARIKPVSRDERAINQRASRQVNSSFSREWIQAAHSRRFIGEGVAQMVHK